MAKADPLKLAEAAELAAAPQQSESCEVKESNDDCTLTYHGEKIETVEQLLASSKVDLRIWEVVETSINNWEVAGRNRKKSGLWKTGLRQIKVRLRRKAPKLVQDGIRDLIKDFRPWKKAVTPKRASVSGRHLLGFYLFDMHFGKRAWSHQAGDNYDLDIADETFRKGFDDLRDKSLRFAPNVDRIVFPIGNDFFHVNDWQSRTGNETRVDSTDDRFTKVFERGASRIINSVKQLAEIAPVDVIWVPGNHDPHTSWHLAFLLKHSFADVKHVNVDISLRARKYYRYGCNVHGLCHGEKVKENKLATLMSSEARHLLDAEVLYREWHLGHLHILRETEFRTEDSFPNLTIRRLPSLCATDGWHDEQGFVDAYKMAESILWGFDEGMVAKFVTHAKQIAV